MECLGLNSESTEGSDRTLGELSNLLAPQFCFLNNGIILVSTSKGRCED